VIIENLLAAVTRLEAEVAAVRDRLDTLENRGPITTQVTAPAATPVPAPAAAKPTATTTTKPTAK
jgi:hypothetical protein